MATPITKRGLLAALAFLIAVGASLLPTSSNAARVLDAERRAGLVGDTASGYMAAVGAVSPEVQRQIDEVNLKRRELYRDTARKTNSTLEAVEAIFGQQLFDRTPSGEYFRKADGSWVKKP
ncbi:MAG: YdbL family protein [Alphaproteobacteria bacterium]|nr:YdbL family protein [Alphaproteobacteria bacterium]